MPPTVGSVSTDPASPKHGRLGRVGAFASIACAIHCAVMPVLIGAGAIGSLSFLNEGPFEWGLVLLAAAVGTFAAWHGFRTHGNVAVVTLILLAVIGLVVHAATHGGEHAGHSHGIGWLGIIAGVALGVAMFVNNRLGRSCHDCVHD